MIHYIYKITNLQNQKEYIGVRSHVDPLNDNYMGSSKSLNYDIKKIGQQFFKKDLLEYYNTRLEAELREAELVNINYVKRLDTYNLRTGGMMGHPLQAIRYDVYNDCNIIIDRYNRGDSAEQIAQDYHVDANVIRAIVPKKFRRTRSQANKLTRKKHPPASMRKDINNFEKDIIELYNNGSSVDSIAAKFECHRDVIKRILKAADVVLRSISDQQKLRPDLKQPRRQDLWSRITEIKVLYSEGKRYTEIAELFNTSGTQIKNMIKKAI